MSLGLEYKDVPLWLVLWEEGVPQSKMLLNGTHTPMRRNSLLSLALPNDLHAISRMDESHLLISSIFQSGAVLSLSLLMGK